MKKLKQNLFKILLIIIITLFVIGCVGCIVESFNNLHKNYEHKIVCNEC